MGAMASSGMLVAPFQFKLVANQIVVVPTLGDKFLVVANFSDAALVQDDDLVGVFDGAEPVRDDHAGASGKHPAQVIHDVALRRGIKRAGGLVEEEVFRILVDGTRQK